MNQELYHQPLILDYSLPQEIYYNLVEAEVKPSPLKLLIKKLHPEAIPPLRTENNAGYDLYAIEDVSIPPGERRLIKTGWAMAIPAGWYGHISDRSSVAFKGGGHCLGKIIDESYRQEMGVIILNTDKEKTLVIKRGERPAQIIFKEYGQFEIDIVDELPASNRTGGFGTSGK